MQNKIGTKEKPLVLKTPPLTSEYTMHTDEKDGKEVLVCTVGKTILLYDYRCLADLHSMLKKHGDWMELGSADEHCAMLRLMPHALPNAPQASMNFSRASFRSMTFGTFNGTNVCDSPESFNICHTIVLPELDCLNRLYLFYQYRRDDKHCKAQSQRDPIHC